MSKKDIYFISDIHLTVRKPVARKELTEEDWVEYQKGLLLQVKKIVGEDLLVITGDLLDQGLSFGSQTIVNIFADCLPENTVFISGNHPLLNMSGDLERALEKGTLGNLVRLRDLKYLYDDTTFDYGNYTFYPFNYRHGRTVEHKEVDPERINVCLGHFLSYEDEIPFYVKDSAVAAPDIIKEFPEYDLFVIGDNHSTFLVQDKYLSPGSLTRRTAKQMNHKPCVWKYNPEDKFCPIYLEAPKAEDVLSNDHIIKKNERNTRLEKWGDDLDKQSKEDITGDFKADLPEYFTKNKTKSAVQNMMYGYILEVEGE